MSRKCFIFVILITLSIVTGMSRPAFAMDTPLTIEFVAAYEKNDQDALYKLIEDNADKIPAEVKTLTYRSMSPKETPEKIEALLFTAEQMALLFKEVTGDFEPLRGVKRQQFEKKLSKAVVGEAVDGVQTVHTPRSSKEKKNYFSPDNIIIKVGETVVWKNDDSISHLFASFSIIGKGGLFTPNIAPGTTWKHTFTEPGEYYYLCFIHKGMVGKITVEE